MQEVSRKRMVEGARDEILVYEKHGKLATLTLNREEALNALNTALLEALPGRSGFRR